MQGPIEIKQFTGMLDTDSANENIAPGSVRNCVNLEWYGPPGNLRPQSVLGTTIIPNALLPGTGVNLTIGRLYDAVRHRLFYFNYNSAGNHCIFIFNTIPGTIQSLVSNGATTNGDVLGFTATGRIHSAWIIYGDPADGDLFCFVDSLGRVRKINVLRLLSGTYNVGGALIQSNYLNLIKAPIPYAPQCAYENDYTVASNELVNNLFLFCATPFYDDFEQGVMSTACRQPLPSDSFDQIKNVPVHRNARIAIYVFTGDQNVTKVRIYGKEVTGGATSDWFIVQDLIKADLGIANNTWYKFLFYNNGTYVSAEPAFSVLDYDYVPTKVNTGECINGNVIALGGCTEGQDFVNPTFQLATSNQAIQNYALNGTLFFAASNGQFTGGKPQYTIYLTGVGTNDGFGNAITLEKVPAIFTVRFKNGSTDISFSFNNSSLFTNIGQILTGIQTAAVSAGWTFVTNTTNSLTLVFTGGNAVLQSYYTTGLSVDNSPAASPVSALFPQASYQWAALYLDENGQNNGAISNATGTISTQAIGTPGQIPQAIINLASWTPPSWAKTWELMRTDNLTYGKYFHWVSNAACQGTGEGVNTQYGYFGISNIDVYNKSINATEGVVSYGFSPGDIVNIVARYDKHGNRTALNFSYPVLSVTVNPLANGIRQIGTYVQIYYPTADINPNFQFIVSNTDTDFQNYEIILLSYKARLPSAQNVFYRIGQQYGIGNPGTSSAYHMGNILDNQVTLTDGDVFYRQRNVPIQSQYFINAGSFDQTSPYGTDWINPGGMAVPIVDNGLWKIVGGVQKVAGLLGIQYPTYAENDMTFFNVNRSF
jgi:hypothetical protein